MDSERPPWIAFDIPNASRAVGFDANYRTQSGRRLWKDAVAGPYNTPVAECVEAIAPHDRLNRLRVREAPRHLPFC